MYSLGVAIKYISTANFLRTIDEKGSPLILNIYLQSPLCGSGFVTNVKRLYHEMSQQRDVYKAVYTGWDLGRIT